MIAKGKAQQRTSSFERSRGATAVALTQAALARARIAGRAAEVTQLQLGNEANHCKK
jgi:hypothetical protein